MEEKKKTFMDFTKKNIKQNLEYYLTNDIEFENITKTLFNKTFNCLKRKDVKNIYQNLIKDFEIKNINLINFKQLEDLLEINEENSEDLLQLFDFQFYIKSIFEI